MAGSPSAFQDLPAGHALSHKVVLVAADGGRLGVGISLAISRALVALRLLWAGQKQHHTDCWLHEETPTHRAQRAPSASSKQALPLHSPFLCVSGPCRAHAFFTLFVVVRACPTTV